jgi:hypothetical protein
VEPPPGDVGVEPAGASLLVGAAAPGAAVALIAACSVRDRTRRRSVAFRRTWNLDLSPFSFDIVASLFLLGYRSSVTG